MEAKAHLKYLRISPRKVSILCDIIRGKDAKTACVYLMQTPKAYHHRCEREGLRRLLWDRKLIPTDCALA